MAIHLKDHVTYEAPDGYHQGTVAGIFTIGDLVSYDIFTGNATVTVPGSKVFEHLPRTNSGAA